MSNAHVAVILQDPEWVHVYHKKDVVMILPRPYNE